MIDVSTLREHFSYDPLTGHFTVIKSWGRGSPAVGARAGSVQVNGYRMIGFRGRRYREHILAVAYVTGAWPTQPIDHRDPSFAARSDNRWSNIRVATPSLNRANAPLRPDNRSGRKGVYRQGSRWRAQVRVDGALKHLGYFDTVDAAHSAYKQAAAAAFGEFARFG